MDLKLCFVWTIISYLCCIQAQIWTQQGAKEVKWFTNKWCVDSKRRNGTCVSLQHCFSDERFPHLSGWSEFITGDYDSCAYINDQGVPFVGACCTTKKFGTTPGPIPITVPTTTTTERWIEPSTTTDEPVRLPTRPPVRPGIPPIPQAPPVLPVPGFPDIPNPAIPPNWPPKPELPPDWPPTHPPLPTHSPGFWPPWFTTAKTTTTIAVKTRPPTSKRPTTPFWWRPRPTKMTTTTTEIPIVITEAPDEIPSEPKCGTVNDAFRVVGGEKAGYWPWMAGLLGKRGLFCGGSLISNYHVLTAAHCVYGNNPNDITIRLGDRDLTTTLDHNHMDVKVSTISVNPSYSTKTNHHDLAIIRLASKVPFNKHILPVCLPTVASSRTFAGTKAVVIGWGATRLRGPTTKTLQQGIFRVLSVNECQNKFKQHFPNQIVSTNICAGDNGKDACSGDSGGPLMAFENNVYTQIGIVSWGVGCGSHNYPGVYTRVSSYMEWIQNNLN